MTDEPKQNRQRFWMSVTVAREVKRGGLKLPLLPAPVLYEFEPPIPSVYSPYSDLQEARYAMPTQAVGRDV